MTTDRKPSPSAMEAARRIYDATRAAILENPIRAVDDEPWWREEFSHIVALALDAFAARHTPATPPPASCAAEAPSEAEIRWDESDFWIRHILKDDLKTLRNIAANYPNERPAPTPRAEAVVEAVEAMIAIRDRDEAASEEELAAMFEEYAANWKKVRAAVREYREKQGGMA